MPISIIIADDHRLFREGLVAVLKGEKDIMVVGEARTGEEAVILACESQPDVILMDLEMPDMDGITATQIIKNRLPNVKVLALSGYDDNEHIYASMKTGAVGYVVKRVNRDELVRIIKSIHEGDIILSPFLANLALQEFQQNSDDISGEEKKRKQKMRLSEQEVNVLKLVVKGYDNEEIGRRLLISKETVKSHLKHIFGKLQVNSRTEAAIIAKDHKLISTD